jgi:glycosyltransferase involved in cell wall biosynthesis
MKSKSKLHSVAVIIPALDEEVGIARVLDALDRDLIDTIIVCDNGSRDATAERARERGAVVVHEERRGYGSACLCALSVLPKETSIVAFIDADFSDDPRELVDILTPIVNDEADLVIGSRVARAERDALTPTQRKILGSRSFSRHHPPRAGCARHVGPRNGMDGRDATEGAAARSSVSRS